MNYLVTLTLAAENDIKNAVDYYDSVSEDAGERFLAELNVAYAKIAVAPQHYKYISDGRRSRYRSKSLSRFPFLIIFRVVGKSVIIVSVHNTNRRNKYLR